MPGIAYTQKFLLDLLDVSLGHIFFTCGLPVIWDKYE